MTEEEKKKTEPAKKKETTSPAIKGVEGLLMKKGDYTVHILIEAVKNLLGKNADFLPKPVVKVSCLEDSKRTSIVSEPCSEYTFNEHMYFEKTDLPVEVLDSS